MSFRPVQRLKRLTVSALLITAMTAMTLAPMRAGTVFAETPPETETATSSDAPSGDAGSGDARATSSDAGAESGATNSEGGDAAGAGGDNTGTSNADTTGGSAGSGGGTGSTECSGSATSGNTSSTTTDTSTGAEVGTTPPEGAVTSTNSTQEGTGGASGTGGDSSTPSATSATATTGGEDAGSTTSASASATSGDATAIGNMSTTEIVQMVLAIVNIVLPGVDPASLTSPLVSITQNAAVTNIGSATASSGGNSAMISILSSIAGQAGMTTSQLAGLVSGQASTASGEATAIGNVTWTEIMQLASVVVSVNGDTSLTDQLTSISQNAQVSNQGSATADSGGNTSSVTIQNQDDPPASDSDSDSASAGAAGILEDVPDDGTNSHCPVLLWGPAASKNMLVWIYVHGKLCKAADTVPDPDFPGQYIWEAKLAPWECNAYRGAKISFIVVSPSAQTVVWDNLVRESPELRLNAGGGGVGSALKSR